MILYVLVLSFLIIVGFAWIAPTFFAVKRSEDKYRILVESSIVGVIIIQLWRIVFVNSFITKRLGYTRDELLALSPEGVAGLVHPEDRQRVLSNMENRAEGLYTPEVYECRVLCKGGRLLWVEIASNRLKYNGKPALQAIVVDINDKKLTAIALQKTEERYRILAEAAHDMIFIIDRDDKIEYVNSFTASYLGLEKQQVVGQPRNKLFPADAASNHGDSLREVFETGKPIYYENPTLIRDKTVWLGTWLVALRSNDRINAVMGISRDITNRKHAEEVLRRDKEMFETLVWKRTEELLETQMRLERAKRLSDIGTLAATVAHELRNPLAAINLAAANIKRKADNPALDKHLQNIEKKILESDEIINNLLFYARMKSPKHEKTNIYNILMECVDISQDKSEKNVSVKNELSALKGISIEVDSLQIKEVFCNILNNAYDAVPDKDARITLSASVDKKSITVAINDNGVGIGPEEQVRIFEPFYTTKPAGTGLGLTVCYQIINMHGGTIDIMSKPDKGTTVTVTLPIGKASA